MASVLRYDSREGKLYSIRFKLDTEKERKLFVSLMAGEPVFGAGCPGCKKSLEQAAVAKGEQFLRVDSPLSGPGIFGFVTGFPYFKCPHCGTEIPLAMVDITPFGGISTWLADLRKKAKQRGLI